jgi:hypothetical protein
MRILLKFAIFVALVALLIDNWGTISSIYRSALPKDSPSRFEAEVDGKLDFLLEASRNAATEALKGLPKDAVAKEARVAVLPLEDDVGRRATEGVEAAIVADGLKVLGRDALDAALAGTDLRATLERLWKRVSPSDAFTKTGADLLVFGSVESAALHGGTQLDVTIRIRGVDRANRLAFDLSGRGIGGPAPGFIDYVVTNPWRALFVVALLSVIVLAILTKGRAIPYVGRVQEEEADRRSYLDSKTASGQVQSVLEDLRGHQDALLRSGDRAGAQRLAATVDHLDQARQEMEKTSRMENRAVDAAGGIPGAAIEHVVRAAASVVRQQEGVPGDPMADLEVAVRALSDDFRARARS